MHRLFVHFTWISSSSVPTAARKVEVSICPKSCMTTRLVSFNYDAASGVLTQADRFVGCHHASSLDIDMSEFFMVLTISLNRKESIREKNRELDSVFDPSTGRVLRCHARMRLGGLPRRGVQVQLRRLLRLLH